jgi:hypothetical protein
MCLWRISDLGPEPAARVAGLFALISLAVGVLFTALIPVFVVLQRAAETRRL